MKWVIVVVVIALCALALKDTESVEVCGRDGCVLAEVSKDMGKGLAGRDSGRMLFIFEEEGEKSFWMKGMMYELDLIWMDGNWTVTRVEKGELCEEECRVYEGTGKYVLEGERGTAERIGVEEGNRLTVNYISD